MTVHVFASPSAKLSEIVEERAKQFFEKYPKINAQVNVFFISGRKIQALNLKYRKIDRPTDVLSFPLWENIKDVPGQGEVNLGDIFISLEQAQKNGGPGEKKLEEEVGFLVDHSLNHLIGKHHKE